MEIKVIYKASPSYGCKEDSQVCSIFLNIAINALLTCDTYYTFFSSFNKTKFDNLSGNETVSVFREKCKNNLNLNKRINNYIFLTDKRWGLSPIYFVS